MQEGKRSGGDEISGDRIDAMASDWHRSERGRFVANERGDFVPVFSLEPPDGVERVPKALIRPRVVIDAPAKPIGPTRIFEWLLVDIRVAKAVSPGSRLYTICQGLCEGGGACGVVEATLVIDLQEVSQSDRAFLLDMRNWPQAGV